jgi:hypothetical protein
MAFVSFRALRLFSEHDPYGVEPVLIVVYIDGLCEPVNPGGTATYGFVIQDDSGTIFARRAGLVRKGPGMSNNVAEYAALREVLLFLANEMMPNPRPSKLREHFEPAVRISHVTAVRIVIDVKLEVVCLVHRPRFA